mmetsp:Transcript_37298/g.125968  ORF Transcript_37298/g.125968 Transcript_37298/m.125968 type:complete len:161 (+) Transcript_37298:4706-5188(+)
MLPISSTQKQFKVILRMRSRCVAFWVYLLSLVPQRRVRQSRAMQKEKHATTSFSIDFSRRLQNLLPTLENLQEANRLSRPALEQHKADASAEVQMWDLDAMAFNVPYTDTNTITSRILATNIHDNRRRDVQFVVGVYVHPIIHRIFSVWVYYGTISPRNP